MINAWFQKIRDLPILNTFSLLGHHFERNGKNQIRSACILPSHPGQNKTKTAFCIDLAKNVWYCHNCRTGGGNIEAVMETQGSSLVEAANFVAENNHMETFAEIKCSSEEERQEFRSKIEEQELVRDILTIAAYHFHSKLTPELRQSLLIPQGNFEPADTWQNLYKTWGLADKAIEDNLIGYDDGSTLLPVLQSKGYSNSDILKSGLFYQNKDGIGKSVFQSRLTFPYREMGKTTNFIARSTSQTWPCNTKNPAETLAKNPSARYAKYKKLPLHKGDRAYVSATIQPQFFGLAELRTRTNGVIVEGITDVILVRMFLQQMLCVGIIDAAQWGVGSFLSNQISNDHTEQLAKAAKGKDTLLFLCDSESSGRGEKGAINTAKKLLEHGVLALIGSISHDADKIDPAQWVRDRWPSIQASPHQAWQEFVAIVEQSRNVVDIALVEARQAMQELAKRASMSYITKIKKEHATKLLDLIQLLPDLEQHDYLALLAAPPFNYKLATIRRLAKARQEPGVLVSQAEVAKIGVPEEGFSFPGVAPEEWAITSDGLFKELGGKGQDAQLVKIAKSPMIISAKLYDIDTGQYYLKTEFYENGHWKARTESREIFMTSRLLPSLAKWGFPVNSENAKKMVTFLTDYEAANRETIKVSQVVSSCGNKTINGEKGFVLGERLIFRDREDSIEFLAPDVGDMQIVRAFESYGELESWTAMLKKCSAFAGVMAAVYATFAGPFLNLLKVKGFTVHLWGRSSIGKTIALIICSSIYGDPRKLIQSWNQREVATERRMALCNEVAIFLDELKQAITKDNVERTLYAVTNGHGRGRGSLKGQQKTLYWLLNLISTGEMPATQTSTDEGGQARVINIRDHLFGQGKKELVRELELAAKRHYGLAGSHFIRHADSERIEKRFQEYLDIIASQAKTDIAFRIGNNLAVMLAVGDEVNRVFGISESSALELIGKLIDELLQDASAIDRGTSALVQVIEWASANEGMFYPNVEFKKDIAGLWKEDEYLAFFPYKLKDILEKFGYNYDAVLRDWAERRWIKCEGKHRNAKIRVTSTKRCRMVILEWERIKSYF